MTVGTQMQKAIASVESVAASMKTYALETQDHLRIKKDAWRKKGILFVSVI